VAFEEGPLEVLKAVLASPATEARLKLVDRGGPYLAHGEEIPRWQDPKIGVFKAPPRGDLEVRRGQTVKVIQGRPMVSQGEKLLAVDFVPNARNQGNEALDLYCDQLIARLDPEVEWRWREGPGIKASWANLRHRCTQRKYDCWSGREDLEWVQNALAKQGEEVKAIERLTDAPLPEPMTEPCWPKRSLIRSERLGAHHADEIPQHSQLWRHLDRFIAQLRRRLEAGLSEAVALPDDTLLISIREGVEAHVTLYTSDVDAPQALIEASIREGLDELAWSALRDRDLKLAVNQPWSGSGQAVPSDLPEAVELHAEGACVRVTFTPDLLDPRAIGVSLK